MGLEKELTMGQAKNTPAGQTKQKDARTKQGRPGQEPKRADPSDRGPTPNDWQPESGTDRDNFGPGLAPNGTGRRDVEPDEI
jgi:hypothetical protein